MSKEYFHYTHCGEMLVPFSPIKTKETKLSSDILYFSGL